MIKLKKVETIQELKVGQTILTVDHGGYESLDYIDCIDNGYIFTISAYNKDEEHYAQEELHDYIESYNSIFLLTNN